MSTGKRGSKRTSRKKPSLSKQTLKDLGPKRGRSVKGGAPAPILTVACGNTYPGARRLAP
jgi:hypothetical protein